ncbi:NARE ribosyltransferase, partial [Zapornia atra]|nr:NARE ribosyltransferase [Zapornia atra]
IEEKALDMAPNSFDDQYLGCRHMMEKELEELNRTEFVPNSNYTKAWKNATAILQNRSSELSVQAITLMAYTLPEPSLHEDLNKAVLTAGRSIDEYLNNFDFKVMHFLLSSALRSLRDAKPHQCYHVYRGINNTIYTAQRGETVRFGYFASSSLNRTRAEMYGNHTIFLVQTCYGVPIWDYALSYDHQEVLIPPFETFEVMNVTREKNRSVIELHAQAVCNKYNCQFVKEKHCKNQPCDFIADQSVSRDPLWGFILAATALA